MLKRKRRRRAPTEGERLEFGLALISREDDAPDHVEPGPATSYPGFDWDGQLPIDCRPPPDTWAPSAPVPGAPKAQW